MAFSTLTRHNIDNANSFSFPRVLKRDCWIEFFVFQGSTRKLSVGFCDMTMYKATIRRNFFLVKKHRNLYSPDPESQVFWMPSLIHMGPWACPRRSTKTSSKITFPRYQDRVPLKSRNWRKSQNTFLPKAFFNMSLANNSLCQGSPEEDYLPKRRTFIIP